MGHPRKLKNHYSSVRRPLDIERIEREKKLKEEYGIKTKHELRKIEFIWRNLRQRARKLIAEKDPEETKILFKKIDDYCLCKENITFENILALKLTDILDRRLQSIVLKLGFAKTQLHSRQLIVHKKIKINDIIIFSPNYIVKKQEENHIILIQKPEKENQKEKKDDKK
ncbi:MAG: 30S ribosomal protein S4 [Candidatus Aenigmarchaeota archaeon ex4484_52]|nr:MAG: 30S ribosomal protein S4 [Candidatus Aenigmarchaeota archaeon ex4484_52]